MTSSSEVPRDVELTAYIDGELAEPMRGDLARRLGAEPDLAARLAELRAGGRDFRPAFDLLLADAPTERLTSILETARIRAAGHRPRRSRLGFAVAAGFLLFVAGGLIGAFLPRIIGVAGTEQAENEPANWRAAVADYLTLYTRDTLASIPDDADMRSAELRQVSGSLALDLTPDKVALPDLALKRAQLFEFKGKPLAQLAYLGASDGPVAFCIIANHAPDAAPRFETREGQNIIFWSKGGRGYLLIGKTSRDGLEALASDLQSRIS